MMGETRYPTLVASLADRAGESERGYHHHTREGREPEFVSFASLHQRASRVAAALQERGIGKGDRVGLILPDSAEFVDAIYGAMMAGAIPVPVYPPLGLGKLDAYLDNTAHILRRAGCRLVLADGRVRPVLGSLLGEGGPAAIDVFQRLVAEAPDTATPRPVDIGPDDVAFLQFTSGSTARPKGVVLTHRNLAHNIEAIGGQHGLRIGEESSAVSWLPLYHDMGLIGFVFTPIYFRTRGVRFLSPLMFLKRPASWLRQVSEFRATITFAPNFAYGLATKRVRDDELDGVDLSCLEVAGCGAEPIQIRTLRAFAERHAKHGFRTSAFLPCYGMAEHSLAVTFLRRGQELGADRVDAAALSRGEAVPLPDSPPGSAEDDAGDPGELLVVNCGKPFPLHALEIVDEDGQPLPERRVGHIRVKGPSVMTGYFDDAEATAEALRGGWLHTGDLGYLVGGDLHVCGRAKDLIIVEGRNYHPQDIEWQAARASGVRTGNVIAFGLDDPELGRERVVVAAETRLDETAHPDLVREVRARILEGLGLRVDDVLLLAPGSLPKTSSGKLQRGRAGEMFRAGTLGAGERGGSWQLVKQLARSRWNLVKASLRGNDR
jgi:fatty-acyl-CoA synthase